MASKQINVMHSTDFTTNLQVKQKNTCSLYFFYLTSSMSLNLDCLHGSWTCTKLSEHWRVFVLVSSFLYFFSGYTCARLRWSQSHSALSVHVKLRYRIIRAAWNCCPAQPVSSDSRLSCV